MNNFLLSKSPNFEKFTNAGLLILRVGMSFFMIHHGYDKLQNFLAGVADFPDPLHVGNRLSMGLTVFAEFFCSILLILGLYTRLATIPLIICMVVVIFIISKGEPLGEREHAIMYLISYIAIFLTGAGNYSIDHKILK